MSLAGLPGRLIEMPASIGLKSLRGEIRGQDGRTNGRRAQCGSCWAATASRHKTGPRAGDLAWRVGVSLGIVAGMVQIVFRLHLLVTAPRSAAVYDEAAWGYNWVFNFQTPAAASFPGWMGEATG